MSILIKGIEMPKSCDECPCRMIGYTTDRCNVLGKFIDFVVGSEGRREDCPLADVREDMDMVDLACWYDENVLYPKRIEGKT